jgi:hypothetical protein
MTVKFKACSLAAAVSALLGGNVWAVEAQSIQLTDGLNFTPSLKLSQYYDDNIRAVENNTESSWVTMLSPKFMLSTENRNSAYALTYELNNEIYSSSHDDDHTDHHVDADAAFQFDSRNKLKLNASYDDVEDIAPNDYVGTDFVPVGNSGEATQYTLAGGGGVYTYGAESAMAQLELAGRYEELRYSNSNGFNDDLEYDSVPLRATGYYRVAPKTRLLLEGRYTDFDYVNNSDFDGTNEAILAGVEWEATAKTSGTFKIGGEERSYDNSVYDDETGTIWEAGIKYSPLTYSVFNLNTRQGIMPGSNGSPSVDSQSTTLAWTHQWLERLRSDVSYNFTNNDYQDSGFGNNDEDIEVFGLGFTYNMRRWLDIGVGYKYATSDSDFAGSSYNRNIYGINFTASL